MRDAAFPTVGHTFKKVGRVDVREKISIHLPVGRISPQLVCIVSYSRTATKLAKTSRKQVLGPNL